MTGGKKINDLENMSTEISQTERKKKKNTFTKVYLCQLQKTKDEEKNLERKGTRPKKHLNNWRTRITNSMCLISNHANHGNKTTQAENTLPTLDKTFSVLRGKKNHQQELYMQRSYESKWSRNKHFLEQNRNSTLSDLPWKK